MSVYTTCIKQLKLEHCKFNCRREMKIIFSLCNQTFITSKCSWLPGLKAYQHTHCELEQDYKISNILQFTVKYSTYNSISRHFSLHKELLLLSVDGFNSVCCLSYRGVRLIESIATVKRLKNGRDQHQVSVLERHPLRQN